MTELDLIKILSSFLRAALMGCRAQRFSGAAPDLLCVGQWDFFVVKQYCSVVELGNRLVFSRMSPPRGAQLHFQLCHPLKMEVSRQHHKNRAGDVLVPLVAARMLQCCWYPAHSHWPCLPQGKRENHLRPSSDFQPPSSPGGRSIHRVPSVALPSTCRCSWRKDWAFTEIEGVLHWGWFPEGSPDTRGRTTTFTLPDAGVPKPNTDFLAADCLGKLEGTLADF